MKPGKLLILFLIILFTILQCTALNYVRIFRIKPDILLILVIFFSLNFGRIYGLVIGALCGLFSEATCGAPAGAIVFVYSLGGLLLGHIGRWVYDQKIFGQMGISLIFSFVIYFFLFFLFQTLDANLSLFNSLISVILPASFYTAAVSPVLFRFLKTILNTR
ncbi:MAG: rod shape-determining protein MreD [Candidatus Omnitrophica bacterium]|nr:rod shape-determining protein MreD [Candidatus Omnitrophota bacterium]MBU3934049.1 rod shape-determining protein MreD [Candidatus Omnitrophota bacterium]MBU4140610.1 rod shape-determining protein MreD [Candidatus Omnitrophota bacterium]